MRSKSWWHECCCGGGWVMITLRKDSQRGHTDFAGALSSTLETLRRLLSPMDPSVQLHGRLKSRASISSKMSKSGLHAKQILDVIGVRVISARKAECYRLVNRIHSQFEFLEQEYDDYIEAPKPNGYQSIHTTVLSPCGLAVEIQLRTHEMHSFAERGPAAHSEYKSDSDCARVDPIGHGRSPHANQESASTTAA